MKLKIEHLAHYLPYGLRIEYIGDYSTLKGMDLNGTICIDDDNEGCHFVNIKHIKPILRPLSDLFKLIDWDNNGEPYMLGYKFHIQKNYEDGILTYTDEYEASYAETPKVNIDITAINWWLFQYHFDIFGLIPNNLAIDINTLNK